MKQDKTPLIINEQQDIESLADWYLNEQIDFNKRLMGFGYQTLKPYLQGLEGLELGSADGQMTQFLVNDFSRLTVVDGSAKLLASIENFPNLVKVHSLFEEFRPEHEFNTIIMAHILEHIKQPVALLKQAKKWLMPEGKILIIVPNGHSIHRLVAVKMGLFKESCELSTHDYTLGHRRVYTPTTLRKDIEESGLNIVNMGGIFFKPLSNQQIQDHWTEEMIQGFYELGKDFPEYAAEIYAVCTADD
ncbi:class I SAM-dependent methyltransferase [Nostoc sp. UCD121]|uniref:class I SAM-dependent methyltransferase n=1 Tax=unclassified Nostoc TaxID=2593658 RepID=UPI00162AAFEA|nr:MULTISPECIES: methyltransferase domain-containing protein [unclassified Nostoc]MBC1225307.1 class I SAM-dependent methyltransferase [Nostoc sp. UCD120]MBC1279976.1 class I SAM-dependent methyltransferase [Nostoc sp. UCD121]MBC1296729.1 class I SAM-dependent methyltransferase [Nostoc sp. UCD122]